MTQNPCASHARPQIRALGMPRSQDGSYTCSPLLQGGVFVWTCYHIISFRSLRRVQELEYERECYITPSLLQTNTRDSMLRPKTRMVVTLCICMQSFIRMWGHVSTLLYVQSVLNAFQEFPQVLFAVFVSFLSCHVTTKYSIDQSSANEIMIVWVLMSVYIYTTRWVATTSPFTLKKFKSLYDCLSLLDLPPDIFRIFFLHRSRIIMGVANYVIDIISFIFSPFTI